MEQSDEEFARLLQEQEYMNAAGNIDWQGDTSKTSITIPDDDADVQFGHDIEAPFKDLHQLFLVFNDQYFESKLSACEVRWSPRMTRCAGLCYYQSKAQYCSIRLSEPLLKFRPESDYIDTLLHEMIHAYLFVTQAIQDHDGHGADFQYHMNRINEAAGTSISIYHTFHDEVQHYQTHVWKCNGPCRTRPPYYGIVRRSMNRPPQPADKWYAEHQGKCGGTYTKISEPEPTKKKTSSKSQKDSKQESESKERTLMDNYFSVSKSPESASPSSSQASPPQRKIKRRGSNTTEKSIHGDHGHIEKKGHSISDIAKPSTIVIDPDSEECDDRPPPRVAAAAAALERFERNLRLKNLSSTIKPEPLQSKRREPGFAGRIEIDDEKSKRIKSEGSAPIEKTQPGVIAVKQEGNGLSARSKSQLIGTKAQPIKLEDNDTSHVGSNPPSVAVDADAVPRVQCPICSVEVEERTINDHVDLCIWRSSGNSE
ncbi:hypothetical protein BGZ80_007979 [Entomortierella chlamydospora]|uniref:Protein with SprT-like domain at the N terminus n=1 Tax=Entomortierella chlamydospora TaxID=101097 RepID=A0A9P6N3V0_9FUNG|nr:hypothetical protein BGZ79_004972 [Entomortierella chlamydospora]KAG0023797.1 hypothetical protein BGZ80_007979 [Entomortierella chlamydospora]